MFEEWISAKEACKLLGINYRTLWRWATKKGWIRFKRLPSGRIKYSRKDIERILKIFYGITYKINIPNENIDDLLSVYKGSEATLFNMIRKIENKLAELSRKINDIEQRIAKLEKFMDYYAQTILE